MPPKNVSQIKDKEKAGEKVKKLAIAALALLVLAMPILAQQAGNATGGGGGGGGVSQGRDLVLKSGAVQSVQSAAGALMAVWGIAWWASLIIFGIYYFVMSKLAPASWARWGYINDLVDKYKWLLLAMILSPFAVGLVVLGVNLAAEAWGQSVQSQLDPLKTVTDFLSKVLIQSVVDAAKALRFW
ncbi:hypothetical protein [Pyrobaculum ferrireducens]|uniref:Uncharacterized protein n=1 Tax=Pyrobaculum ferrireducens TaxID=1104324 RepID=G7VF00_9CREN|nr:hypothetical protein [Pyrobaculum ferrireducens]AET34165.1 hypothetical protein P186_2789 [Pyrobaculum ferrireducens]